MAGAVTRLRPAYPGLTHRTGSKQLSGSCFGRQSEQSLTMILGLVAQVNARLTRQAQGGFSEPDVTVGSWLAASVAH